VRSSSTAVGRSSRRPALGRVVPRVQRAASARNLGPRRARQEGGSGSGFLLLLPAYARHGDQSRWVPILDANDLSHRPDSKRFADRRSLTTNRLSVCQFAGG